MNVMTTIPAAFVAGHGEATTFIRATPGEMLSHGAA
jgi:hypothetical protein